jgi:acyl carrier protein
MPEQHAQAEVVAVIERIFSETLSITPPAPEVDIIDAGLLDSLGLVTLLFEIEQELGVQMPLESLEVDDFRSIEAIARLIAQMRGAEQGNAGESAAATEPRGAPSR